MKCPTCNGTGDVIIEKHFCDCPECDGVGEMSCSLSELRSVAFTEKTLMNQTDESATRSSDLEAKQVKQ